RKLENGPMTANVRVTRRATFAAAHVLCRSEWSDERNREAFGEDVNEHGHSYVVEVTVGGTVDPDTGMVVNLSHVDDVLRREFIDAVDHPAVLEAKPRGVPRTRDHVAVELALVEWPARMRAHRAYRAQQPLAPHDYHRQAVRLDPAHLALGKVIALPDSHEVHRSIEERVVVDRASDAEGQVT